MTLLSTLVVVGSAGLLLVLVSLVVGDLDDTLSAAGAAVAAFGTSSALALSADLDRTSALVLGALLALAVAVASLLGLRLLLGGGTPAPSDASLFGVLGRVVTPVPDRGYGEVVLVVAGSAHKLAAVAERPLPAGTPVCVVDVLSSTSVLVDAVDPSFLELL